MVQFKLGCIFAGKWFGMCTKNLHGLRMNGEIFKMALENSIEMNQSGKAEEKRAQECCFVFSNLSFLRVFQQKAGYTGH